MKRQPKCLTKCTASISSAALQKLLGATVRITLGPIHFLGKYLSLSFSFSFSLSFRLEKLLRLDDFNS